MPTTQLKVHEPDPAKRFLMLDKIIRESAKSFVECGLALLQMREGQEYKNAPNYPYETFEDYVKDVHAIKSKGQAYERIKAALVHKAIEDQAAKMTGSENQPRPEDEAHCLALTGTCTWKLGAKPKTGGNPGVVSIKNPEKVAQCWAGVAAAYETQRAGDLERHPDRVPRKLTSKFINEHLPKQYQKDPVIKSKRAPCKNDLQRVTRKVVDTLNVFRTKKLTRSKAILAVAERQDWSAKDCQAWARNLKTLTKYLEEMQDAIENL